MRHQRIFNYIILTLICQLFVLVAPTSASVQDFYFEDFTADYYLEEDPVDGSKLRVKEQLTAIFPDYNQNKGICRAIPFLNQDGANITLENLSASNLKVSRNGSPEPIYSIEKSGQYFEACTGTEEYLTGRQVYTLEYEFHRVITEFSSDAKTWQELYWDTNGTAWKQRFNSLTARIHFSDPSVWTGEKWCYVGRYGVKGSNRCEINPLVDGVEFKTTDLARGENLTFVTELKPGSFSIPEPKKSYVMVFIFLGVLALSALIFINPIKNLKATKALRKFHKDYFIKPEYQPHKDYSLPEITEVYLGEKKDVRVAVLLKMIIDQKINLVKGKKSLFGSHNWEIIVIKNNRLAEEESIILSILNNGETPVAGDKITLKKHTANNKLVSLGRKFNDVGVTAAKSLGLVTKKYSNTRLFSLVESVVFLGIAIFCFTGLIGFFANTTIGNDKFDKSGHLIVGFSALVFASVTIFSAAVIARTIINSKVAKFLHYTEAGIIASRYMDGLKLYIKMAEAERLAFLSSTNGADTSPSGIVKLYEKLLPYAAVFGLEKTWLKELGRYYQMDEVNAPEWYNTGNALMAYELSRSLHAASSIASSSTIYHSSGSSSSGFSGGGGGGFSGGGGGGGGGGGR